MNPLEKILLPTDRVNFSLTNACNINNANFIFTTPNNRYESIRNLMNPIMFAYPNALSLKYHDNYRKDTGL